MDLRMVGLPAKYRQRCRGCVSLRTEEMALLRANIKRHRPWQRPVRKSDTCMLTPGYLPSASYGTNNT